MAEFPEKLDAAVIGAGPGGIGAALALHDLGLRSLAVFERNAWIGGVLNQCIHTGFGLDVFGMELTGPQFARRLRDEISVRNIPVFTGAMVLESGSDRILVSSREHGIREIIIRGLVLASGCRERTRENLEIPGTRPAGIFTAGQAQTLINLENYRIGNRIVIQGSGDIGLIMARRLTVENCEVVGVMERLPYLSGLIRNKVQCLDHFGIPLHFSRQITKIRGKHRVEAVETAILDESFLPVPGTEEVVECDTVLFSVGLIPELELVDNAGVGRIDRFNPETGKDFQTNVPGIFICGNSLHINDLADTAFLEGKSCGEALFKRISKGAEPAGIESGRPYTPEEKNRTYNRNFFENLSRSGEMVCIICPRGCILREGEYGCPRGEAAFHRPREKQLQRFSTTVIVPGPVPEKPVQLPAVSLEEVEVGRIPELKKRLEFLCGELDPDAAARSAVEVNVDGIVFEIG